MNMWLNLTQSEKLNIIDELHNTRISLLEQSKIRRAKRVVKNKKPKMTFRSKKLEDVFNKMPTKYKKLFI